MAGHSKWANIKHKKAATDAKRGKIFTRLIKELTVAARAAGGDPDMNPRLRTIIAEAKQSNMPADNIKRAIRRGTGEEPGVSYEEVLYEAYGPGGAAMIIDMLTDNKNRAVGEIRHVLTKHGGNLAETNAVAWMFTKRGYIVVDDRLQTTAPGVWALGDCNGKGAFTHTAYNDFEIVAANLLDQDPRGVSERITAYALYIDPPLGRVGMTLAEARNSGRRVLAGERPMTRVARAVEKGETLGFMRILVDGDSEEILGASLLGTGCDEAVHAILDLMYVKAPYTVMQRAMHIHPTVSELLPTILGDLKSVG